MIDGLGGFGGPLLLWSRAEHVGAKVVTGDVSPALFIKPTRQSAVETLTFAQRLPQVSDGGPSTLGVFRLLGRGHSREIGAQGVHADILPGGKAMSIPEGQLLMGNVLGSYAHG